MKSKILAVLLALLLPTLALAGTAEAAPRPVEAEVRLVEGTPTGYNQPTEVYWRFTGKEGQFPRLNVIFVCWRGTESDLESLTDSDVGPQGYPAGVDLVTAQFHWLHWDNLYPGEGTVTYQLGGYSQWDIQPGDAICAATLNDWQSQRGSGPPRRHATVRWFADDPRV